jgi:hypothetical protein
MKEENESINKESIKSLKEFREKQVQNNIKIHIFFLLIIICINICLLIFIISFKIKIKHLTSKTKKSSSNLSQNRHYLASLESSLSHKVVNILAVSLNSLGNLHFSFLFENSDEVQSVKNSIISYIKFEIPFLHLIYGSNIDTDNSSVILKLIRYWPNLLFIVGSQSGIKFGFFLQESIYLNKLGIFKSNVNRCFIYSFMHKKEFTCNEKDVCISVNDEELINIGNGDIIINHRFKTNGGIINFPFKSFEVPKNDENAFIGHNGEFQILDIELYVLY